MVLRQALDRHAEVEDNVCGAVPDVNDVVARVAVPVEVRGPLFGFLHHHQYVVTVDALESASGVSATGRGGCRQWIEYRWHQHCHNHEMNEPRERNPPRSSPQSSPRSWSGPARKRDHDGALQPLLGSPPLSPYAGVHRRSFRNSHQTEATKLTSHGALSRPCSRPGSGSDRRVAKSNTACWVQRDTFHPWDVRSIHL